MAVYRDPGAPPGRIVFGGIVFIDGLTADITAGESTRELFAACGISKVDTPAPETPAEDPPASDKEPRRRK